MAGRLVMIASILNALPNYQFQAFLAPNKVVDHLNKLRNSCLWNHKSESRKIHHFSFDMAKIEQIHGGLGIKDLKRMNSAFLCKKFWNIMTHPTKLLSKLYAGKYL